MSLSSNAAVADLSYPGLFAHSACTGDKRRWYVLLPSRRMLLGRCCGSARDWGCGPRSFRTPLH